MTRFTIDCGKSIQFAITDDMLVQLGQHQQAFDHVLMIGLKNLVQDSHASIKREDYATEDEWKAAARAKAEMKLGAILSGDMRVSTAARAPKLGDAETFMRKWLVAKLKAAVIAKHGKDTWKAKTEAEDGAAFIEALIEKNAAKFQSEMEAAWAAEQAERAKAKALTDSVDLDI